MTHIPRNIFEIGISEEELNIIEDFIIDLNYQISKLEFNLGFIRNDLLEIYDKLGLATEERRKF
ncbi:hypothetical protein PIROE2DRAFT_5197 [Piromyces sp. E2]|nr:hypothetical protein PIROE2DRAFT_5197 [Piromyces sp. E2]|eukprot:OUM67340.1 hypothetical protein PIROE2DRAFT_5197 [Piromyces sp. E2]